jgi:hypothetical protein
VCVCVFVCLSLCGWCLSGAALLREPLLSQALTAGARGVHARRPPCLQDLFLCGPPSVLDPGAGHFRVRHDPLIQPLSAGFSYAQATPPPPALGEALPFAGRCCAALCCAVCGCRRTRTRHRMWRRNINPVNTLLPVRVMDALQVLRRTAATLSCAPPSSASLARVLLQQRCQPRQQQGQQRARGMRAAAATRSQAAPSARTRCSCWVLRSRLRCSAAHRRQPLPSPPATRACPWRWVAAACPAPSDRH